MDFEKYKKIFDESFGKVTPDEFIKEMKKLGYKFKSKHPCCPKCESKNIFFYDEGSCKEDTGSCKDCFFEWDKI